MTDMHEKKRPTIMTQLKDCGDDCVTLNQPEFFHQYDATSPPLNGYFGKQLRPR